MKRFRAFLLMIAAAALLFRPAAAGDVRPAAVAGSFYPSDPGKLSLAIRKCLEESPAIAIESPVAILAPHAGYVYAGQIYADAYRQVMGRHYDVVVVLGVNHTSGAFSGVSLGDYSAFRTPLGETAVDQEIVSALLGLNKDCNRNRLVHIAEHSIEVQIPFIQTLFPEAKIVPAIIHPPDPELCSRFGDSLARVLKNRRALIVISTDLSHYPAAMQALRADKLTLETIAKMDARQILSLMRTLDAPGLETRACGEASILAGLKAAKSLGAKSATVAGYANSGEIGLGDPDRAVGYGALIFARDDRAAETKAFVRAAPPRVPAPLQDSEKKSLLDFARETIRRYLEAETVPSARRLPARTAFRQGAFVTLKAKERLRGCIGHMASDMELGKTVGAMALQAAFNDPRFSPVRLPELDDIEIEISILSPMKSIKTYGDIVVGRDGVLLTKESKSAVFLPQVAVENSWNRNEMLDNLCIKAGLSKGCWKRGADFQVFQAEVFSESQFKKGESGVRSRKSE